MSDIDNPIVERRPEQPLRPELPFPPPGINWPVVLRALARWALVLGLVALVLALLGRAGGALTPFVVGLVMAYVLLPVVKRLDRFMPRWAAVTAVYLAGILLLE